MCMWKKGLKSLTKYIIFSIVLLLTYTVISMILFYMKGTESSTLTTCFFAAFGGEILTCGLIKIFKIKEKDDNGSET